MPEGDAFPYGEERRLFYVALTRARSSVALFAESHRPSVFLTEIVKDDSVKVFSPDAEQGSAEACPVCRQGLMVQRESRYGPFLSCSRFPRCRHKRNLS